MTYSGKNVEVQTVQIWRNGRWEPLDLRLDDAFSTTPETLWRDSQSVLGFTGQQDNRESLSHYVSVAGAALVGADLAKGKVFLVVDAPDGSPIPIDPGLTFNGYAPPAVNPTRLQSRLFIRVTVGVSRVDGSSWSTQRFITSWRFSSSGAASPITQQTTNVGGTNVVVATRITSTSPVQPRLLFSQSGTSSAVRYYIELDATFVAPVE